LTPERVLEILEESEALLTGHFLLASGLHSDTYLQCALAFRSPKFTEELAAGINGMLSDAGVEFDTVCGPALGGVVIGYEMARQRGVPSIFTERKGGVMMLRRGFGVSEGERIVVAEDVVTTGGSVEEVIEIFETRGARVVAVTAIVNRGGDRELSAPMYALAEIQPPVWEAADCPACASGIPLVKPGGSLRREA
jgi:orotate phosphoribosyltransferase